MMDLLINNGLTFEKNNNKDIIYSINEQEYKKINNFSNVLTKLNYSEVDKFIKYKNILYKDNNYYLLNNSKKEVISYIGSNINITNYTDEYVIFTSNNYYCDNYKYLGLLDSEPECNYIKEESTFKLVFLENNLVIDNLDSIINIIK